MAEDQSHYVELSGNPIRFEPISRQTNVFYDEVKRQVFAVRSGGAFGVVVKGPDEKTSTTFRMEDKGPVISIKFSSDLRILAVQRSQRTVEFINFHTGSADTSEYSQMCKGKNTKIIGFNWISGNEIVFITDHGLELYQVTAEKKTLRSMKNVSISINWFTFMNESALLLVSSSTLGNVLTPIHCKTGNISKLPKFEVDLPVVPKPPKLCLLERDVTIAILCGIMPDNLVVVHHQASKTSMVFDIGLTAGETDNNCNYHHPVLAPLPIKPVKLKVAGIPTQTGLEMREVGVELYSPNWVVFQPNIVIDAKLGCLWHISLRLDALVPMIPDKCRLIDFLLLRRESKKVILYVLQTALVPGQHCNLATIAKIFNKLNEVYRSYLAERHALHAEETSSPKNSQSAARVSSGTRVVIEQSDMYTHVLTPVAERKDSNHKFLVAVLVEYIRSLNQYQIPVQHFLYELVINTLVHHNCFYQLHQFLQYHVLSDSKPIACLLLSLESCYPPAYQLALDMLKRLTTANEEIIEVLLSKNQILAALRFLRSVGGAENASSRKFLEAALNADDDMLFYTVFKFFEQRNLRMRGNPMFAPGEHCEKFVHVFEQKFGYESFVPIQ
nr:regulator of MON1-CCZ1 complex-like [Lytechinus pictus]